ncbi:hypothetical protein [Natrialba aegyptia]|uniref:Uncharacterized protein n=1 Tax=Natrialba aegyptia DSM 13077 TaxID=1227491 RepID=M0B9Q1_9EURY|nr:hypothetical protein [Natrialba aegyptia]ELZ07003.1 hypothetical protein C480_08267 [Natrialba aegyptia DSM 13077]
MYEKRIGSPQRDPFDALVDGLAAADRYDFVLGIIPIAFAVALVVATVTNAPVTQPLAVAALVGIVAIVDACYRNPPIDQGST